MFSPASLPVFSDPFVLYFDNPFELLKAERDVDASLVSSGKVTDLSSAVGRTSRSSFNIFNRTEARLGYSCTSSQNVVSSFGGDSTRPVFSTSGYLAPGGSSLKGYHFIHNVPLPVVVETWEINEARQPLGNLKNGTALIPLQTADDGELSAEYDLLIEP